MTTSHEQLSDLPVLRTDDADLPVFVEPAPVTEEQADPTHPDWSTVASWAETHDVAVASNGDVWLATAGGMIRWRGRERFTRFSSEHGLCGSAVEQVVVDGNDTPWCVDAHGGLSYLDGDAWQPCELGDPVACMAVDLTGRVWLGTQHGLLLVEDDRRSTLKLPFDDGLIAGEPPRAIATLDESDTWVCSARGLFHFHGGRWQRRSHRSGIVALARDPQRLWLGTIAGLTCVELDTEAVSNWAVGLVTALAPTTGGVWAATERGVGRIIDGSWHPPPVAPSGRVAALAVTRDDELCVGADSGLWRADATSVRPWTNDSSSDVTGPRAGFGGLVQAVACAPDDDVVWIGTAGGLFEHRPATGAWRHIAPRRVSDVRALEVDAHGLQVGSWTSGLRKLRDGTLGQPILADPVIAITRDRERAGCFVATLDTVYLVKPGQVTRLLRGEDLARGALLRSLARDEQRRLLIGTADGLFVHAEPTGVRLIRGDLVGADVRAVLRCPSGFLIGTNGGLYCLDSERLTQTSQVLASDVRALACDRDGTVWVGTATGLVRLAPDQGSWQVAAHMTSKDSGLVGDRVGALAIDSRDRLWIGTDSGLSVFTRTE